jgi:hypothetical protein
MRDFEVDITRPATSKSMSALPPVAERMPMMATTVIISGNVVPAGRRRIEAPGRITAPA